jgi:hypothetical protein
MNFEEQVQAKQTWKIEIDVTLGDMEKMIVLRCHRCRENKEVLFRDIGSGENQNSEVAGNETRVDRAHIFDGQKSNHINHKHDKSKCCGS